ncbi:hypothetical protein ACFU9Y_41435 [Streptomyces sp. NPDC057621]|uniref:hypothetical protein n=1 Tax=unclassified Streptomyces TaxID=2593676 RepID=UPI00367F4C5E
MAQETTSFAKYEKKGYESQVAALRLNGEAVVTNIKSMKRTFLSVSLEGSNVAASIDGTMQYDKDDLRGYFCDQVDVTMSLDNPAFTLRTDSPQTTSGVSSVTSSSQFQLDVSTGTFGPVPTTGASAGLVIGTSFSRSLEDWKAVNLSTATSIKQSYRMAASEGAAYETPTDLIDMSAKGQLEGCPLFHVPDLSLANMPLMSTAIFASEKLQGPSRPNLTVTVTGHFVRIEKTFEFFVVKPDVLRKPWTWQYTFPVTVPAAD